MPFFDFLSNPHKKRGSETNQTRNTALACYPLAFHFSPPKAAKNSNNLVHEPVALMLLILENRLANESQEYDYKPNSMQDYICTKVQFPSLRTSKSPIIINGSFWRVLVFRY